MNNAISSALALVPLVLAQSSATGAVGATELGQWLLAGAALAVIANQGVSFFRNLTGGFARKQTPRGENMPDMNLCDERHRNTDERLRLIDESLTQKVGVFHTNVSGKVDGIHGAVTQRIDGVESTVLQKVEALRLEIKGDMQGVHSRVDKVLAGVSRLEGKTS